MNLDKLKPSVKQIVFFIFIILAFSLAWSTVGVIQKNYVLQQELDELRDEVALLEVENQNLKYNIEYYKSDDYLELEARAKFNKAASGESVLLLPKDVTPSIEAKKAAKKPVIEEPSQAQENFDSWMTFLFGN